jgi:Ran GTPase-activating protein (RanGAP) involved in mRNA processing and transport
MKFGTIPSSVCESTLVNSLILDPTIDSGDTHAPSTAIQVLRLHLNGVADLPLLERVFERYPLICSLVVEYAQRVSFGKSSGIPMAAAIDLNRCLQLSHSLINLSLCGAGISDSHITTMFEGLSKCTQLTDLDLSRNHIGDDGARCIANLLHAKYCLNILNLKANGITSQGCFFLSQAIGTNSTLEHLDLSSNSIGDHGVSDLTRALCFNSTLRQLAVSCCGMTNGSLPHLAILFGENESLRVIDISGNSLGGGLEVSRSELWISALTNNKTLEVLDMKGSEFNEEVACRMHATLDPRRPKQLLPRLDIEPLMRAEGKSLGHRAQAPH